MSRKKITNITEPGASILGSVTVIKRKGKAVVGKVTTHNNAVANMLIGISRFIRGDFLFLPEEGKSFIPAYLGVGYSTTDADKITSFAQTQLANELSSYSSRFDVAKQSVSINSEQKRIELMLSVVIPSGALPTNTDINELGLFANRARANSGLLARVVYLTDTGALATDITDSSAAYHIKIQTGMSYEIQWTIILKNN